MKSFNPSPKTLVVNELIEKGYIPDYDDALRLCHELEEEEQTDGKFAIGLTAVGIVGAGVTLAFCGAVAPLLVPIAAIGVGISGVWNHPIRATRRDDEADFLRANPSIVPLIEARLQNKEATFKVAAAYQERFRAWRVTGQPLALPSVATPNQPTEIATSSTVGNVTRLGAVTVAASPVPQTSGASWQTPDSQIAPQTPITSKLREVCDRNNSFYIAGSKGSGKGMFAANLLRWKLDQYPSAIALVLDPKGDVKESGYWKHERIRHFSFKGIALSSEQYAEKVIEFLSEARNLVSQADVTRGMRLFLVLDELLTLKETLSNGLFAEFRRFGVSAISTGDSEGIHLIAITQSFNAGDSFGSDELLKNFTQVGLFREDEYTRAKKLIQFGRSNGELTEAEFKALIRASEKDRVMAIAGEFIPTPTLTNHSAFDRDSGKVIKQMPLGSSPSESDILASELSQKIQQMTATDDDETDSDELAIRAEVKRFLLANAEGSKPRDLSARARKPVKGMVTEDIKFVLDLMTLEGDIYEVEGTYFIKTN